MRRLFFFVCAASSLSFAAPTLTLRSPELSAVGDILTVAVSVQSQYVLTSIIATAGSVSVPLTQPSSGDYIGTLDLSALSQGPVTLTISATDAIGQTATLQKPLVHSSTPVMVIAAPLDGTVARPMVDLQATCSAALGCIGIEVRRGTRMGMLLASSSASSISQSISLASNEGTTVQLVFVAHDANGPMEERTLTTHVESSSKLSEVVSVSGPILDADSTRILFRDSAGLHIRTIASGLEDDISTDQPVKGFLTSVGAIWPGGEWSNGQTLATPSTNDLRARNGIAAWSDGRAFVRNLSAGTTQVFDAGVFSAIDAVADNGDVLASWMPDPGAALQEAVMRYRAGTWTPVASGPRHHRGRTDGINVVFQSRTLSGTGPTSLVTASGQLVSLGYFANAYVTDPEKDYRLNGGWVAFTRSDSNMVMQVHRRDPAGTQSLVSVWTTPSYVDGLDSDGEAMVIALNQRHLAAPGQPAPTQISSSLGRSLPLASGWHVILGRTLFSVALGADGGLPDAGSPDAGTVDAGASDAGAADGGADGGDVDAGESDGGLDAGPDSDAGVSRDGGETSMDGGVERPDPPKSCGCGIGEGAFLAALVIPLLRRRPRRLAP